MHCPNCGSEAPAGQKFCRACGLSLDGFAQLLAKLLPDEEDENVAQARRRLRLLERALKIAGWTTGSALGILFTVLGVLTMTLTHVGAGVILLLFGIGFIATMLIVSYQSFLNKKVSGILPAQPTAPSAETTNKILSEDQPRIAMSVAEQTTARLGEKIEPRRSDQ
jgi:zinc-ribbon domain